MNSTPTENSAIQAEVADFTLKAGQRVLLERSAAEFAKGKITLIVGPSGVGKSLLLKILSGIQEESRDGIYFDGRVEIEGQRSVAGSSAIVFQNFALFDEFSPRGNVRFAIAHRSNDAEKIRARDILSELNVPTNVPTSRLSGGQRQRLAIARALAYGKPTVFFDEPTAGLDLGTAEKVAQLIRRTCEDHGTTAIIVTHDYQSLVPIADDIYFLDPTSKTLDKLPPEEWSNMAERLQTLSETTLRVAEEQAKLKTGWTTKIKTSLVNFFSGTTRALEEVAKLPLRVIPLWRSPMWGGRFFWHYLNLITGVTAIIYLVVAGLILGFVTMYFTFEYMPFPQFSRPLIIEDILAAVGFGLYRIIIPVIGTVLIAARCGSAVTADVGSKEYGRQLDAMRSLNAAPNRYLLTNILFSFLIGTPLLIFLSFQAARWISLLVFLALNPNVSADFWHQYFHRNLESMDTWLFIGTWWVLTKVLICGVGIGLIAYLIGRKPKLSSTDVSHAVTRTTLYTTIFVLTVHFVFAFFEFNRLE